jgi:chromosome partitioning protein
MQKRLLKELGARHLHKRLPEFGIERAAELAGCTANHIRNLEARKEIPPARTVKAGSTDRRVYDYNDINRLRDVIGTRPSRPDNTSAVRIVFSNLKGGVAKTTMTLHFAQYAAREGYRVLLVDMDPQATTTSAFGFIPDLDLRDGEDLESSLLGNPQDISAAIHKTYWEKLDLIPARIALQFVDWKMSETGLKESKELGPPAIRLHRALKLIEHKYDLVAVDTPPALNRLSVNSICAANLIIMPITPHMYDISSSIQYFRILEEVCNVYGPEINVNRLSILLTKVDNSTETMNNIALLNGAYGELVLNSRMGLTKELQKSASDQLSIYEIETPRGSRDTYNRALIMMDSVNLEILLGVRQLWDQQLSALAQNKQPAAQRKRA